MKNYTLGKINEILFDVEHTRDLGKQIMSKPDLKEINRIINELKSVQIFLLTKTESLREAVLMERYQNTKFLCKNTSLTQIEAAKAIGISIPTLAKRFKKHSVKIR